MTAACPTLITSSCYRSLLHNPDLLCVLLEQTELEALIQLQLPDVPGLVEVLSGGVQLVQQLGDAWDQALGVGITDAATATAAATAAAAGAAVAVGESLAALNPLKQPGHGLNKNKKRFLLLFALKV